MSTLCPVIVGLTLDDDSLKAIEKINDIHDLTKMGRIALLIGQLMSIFGGSTLRGSSGSGLKLLDNSLAFKLASSEADQTSYSIYQSNWEYFFESFSALDKIAIKRITDIAGIQALKHYSSPKEYRFWRAINQGCMIK